MLLNKTRKIVLVGGSTAGHILPLLSVYKELEKNNYEFLYIGSSSKMEDQLLSGYNIKREKILCGKLRRDSSIVSILKNIFDFFLIIIGTIQSFFILASFKPDLVFTKSSYISVPTVLAARALSIPSVIHESDITAGLATRVCARFAHAIFTAFPAGLFPRLVKKKAIHTGLPIREEFENSKDLSDDYILITGGSLGARELNSRMLEVIPRLLEHQRIVHLTGKADFAEISKLKNSMPEKLRKNYELTAFSDDMPRLMRGAKLIISRAGATSIFEIASLGKKLLLVPITSGIASHQVDNAIFLKELNMAEIVMPDDNSSKLLTKINNLIKGKPPEDIKSLFFPNSAKYIAELIDDFIDFYSLKKLKNIFMIGLGGVSMKGIAEILKKLGISVRGSDLKSGGHSKDNINLSYDLIVYSSAASKASQAKPEHEQAERLNIRSIKRSKMIGWLMKGFRGISISGMHGKTSVTALVARLFEQSKLDPSYLIGAPSSGASKSSHLGSGIDFICEACEYDGSFLDFKTKIAVITNIEEEHLDYFKGGIKQIIDEFSRFVCSISPGGALIYCEDDKNVKKVIEKTSGYLKQNKIELISYGFAKETLSRVSDYKVEAGLASFKINDLEFSSDKIGKFFALNCAAMYSVGKFLGLSDQDALLTVENFKGAARRFEFLGERKGVKVYDDYAHHPTEIEQTLKALSEKFPKSRKIVIFEPHQQKRFNDFFDEFVRVFSQNNIDYIGVLPVYRVAGRDDQESKSIDNLIKKINNPKIIPLKDYNEATNFVEENLKNGDILMTMGATDVYKIARNFLNN